MVTSRVAARLRKRKERTTDDEETLLSFPANKGFRAFLDGTFERTKTWRGSLRASLVFSVELDPLGSALAEHRSPTTSTGRR
jgi:hypothetical protein